MNVKKFTMKCKMLYNVLTKCFKCYKLRNDFKKIVTIGDGNQIKKRDVFCKFAQSGAFGKETVHSDLIQKGDFRVF